MNLNNYYSLAINDLQFLQYSINSGFYNSLTVQCQQVVEKAMKSIAENITCDERVLKTHNLRTVLSEFEKNNLGLNINSKDISFIKDFYYNSRYPGDDFIEATKNDLIDCLDIMYSILDEINKFREQTGLYIVQYEKIYPNKMDKLQAFTEIAKNNKGV